MVKKTPAYKNKLRALELERSGGVTNKKKSQKNLNGWFMAAASSQSTTWDDDDDDNNDWTIQKHGALMNALVRPQTSLTEIYLVGQTDVKAGTSGRSMPCLVLSTNNNNNPTDTTTTSSCLVLPVTTSQRKLVSFAVQNQPLSKSVLLGLNPLLVNRDDGLFDNIPWSTWTSDPEERNKDAANNFILEKFHYGKRDAFAKFGGKDWKARSWFIGNLALRFKYLLQENNFKEKEDDDNKEVTLTQRILDMQIREYQQELAQVEYELAIAKQREKMTLDEDAHEESSTEQNDRSTYPTVSELENQQERHMQRLNDMQNQEEQLAEQKDQTPLSFLESILDQIAEASTGTNGAPYRGATGYAPLLDSATDVEESTLPYTSPFEFMVEILQDQCKANVIGALLENTSLLEGTIAVGGAIVLQRITAKRMVQLDGEEVSISDETIDYGNTGLQGGDTVLVECNVDEAIGMALAAKVALRVESEILSSASIECNLKEEEEGNEKSNNVLDVLPRYEPQDVNLSFLKEGQARNASESSNVSPLRIPRPTTTSLFDEMFDRDDNTSDGSRSSSLFPTDNPIQSLATYDGLSISDKARTLLSMSNFNGKLPRPRILRTSSSNKSGGNQKDALDDLLLPLVDESVRRQYLIREAEMNQDWETVQRLESTKSRRQFAKEMVEEAMEMEEDEDIIAEWETEAEFYASLRADVTQDEGAYNRFLDKDEWYERDRRAQVDKLDKKKFGSLLDGIE